MSDVEIQFFDTKEQSKRKFEPLISGKVGLYVCGVTVYDLCHLGHARSQVAFDVIQRTLRKLDFDLTYVRNFTDVDDKIIKRANSENSSWKEVADRYIEAFYRDMDALGIQRPEYEPRVSRHIKEIIDSVKEIIANGYGYEVDGDVYFSVEDCPWYGELSGRKLEEMEAGARVEVDPRKRHPMDFALWKSAKPGEPYWDSPWGKGRPGWHIECSVMSTHYLGPDFDIHGGGQDLIFPHHENERAQALAHRPGSQFARYWIHNGFVNIGGEKMAKSLGNFFTIRELLQRYTGEALRHYLLSTHYRKPINFEVRVDASPEEKEHLSAEELRNRTKFPGLDEAAKRVHYYHDTMSKLRLALRKYTPPKKNPPELFKKEAIIDNTKLFWQSITDDFNTPAALGSLSPLLKLANDLLCDAKNPRNRYTLYRIKEQLEEFSEVLGIMEKDPEEYLEEEKICCVRQLDLDLDEIEKLIRERAEARARKDWKRADQIRDILKAKGIVLCDGPEGTSWYVEM